MRRVMIVDDERFAREALEKIVHDREGYEVIAKAVDGDEALKLLETVETDIIFLDVDMPGRNGLEVAAQLAEWENPPLVVFATAYDAYALAAFDANALDYVLKPYDEARFNKTFSRIGKALQTEEPVKDNLTALKKELIADGKINLLIGYRHENKTRKFLDPHDICYFEIKDGHVYAHLDGETWILKKSLSELIEEMDPSLFTQTHRSFLVNLEKINTVEPMFNSNYEIVLKGSQRVRIPLSRSYVPKVKKLLGGW